MKLKQLFCIHRWEYKKYKNQQGGILNIKTCIKCGKRLLSTPAMMMTGGKSGGFGIESWSPINDDDHRQFLHLIETGQIVRLT